MVSKIIKFPKENIILYYTVKIYDEHSGLQMTSLSLS